MLVLKRCKNYLKITIVANSFTDLLNRKGEGDSWYWYHDDFESLGDAYDVIELV